MITCKIDIDFIKKYIISNMVLFNQLCDYPNIVSTLKPYYNEFANDKIKLLFGKYFL